MAAPDPRSKFWEACSRRLQGWFVHRLRARSMPGAQAAATHDADELRQETLAIVVKRLHERGVRDGSDSALERFLWGVAENVLRRALARARRPIPPALAGQQGPCGRVAETREELADALLEDEEVRRIDRVLEPDLVEVVALLRHLEIAEAALALQIPSAVVVGRMARAARVRRAHDEGRPLPRLPSHEELARLEPRERTRRIYDCCCCDAEIAWVCGLTGAAVRQWRAYHALPAWPMREAAPRVRTD